MVDEYEVAGYDHQKLGLEFTERLFRRSCRPQWVKHLGHLNQRPTAYLEIGVFEGRSLCWVIRKLLQHPDSRACGIDAWDNTLPAEGNESIIRTDLSTIEARARRNVAKCDPAAILVRTKSLPWLSHAVADKKTYDLIYIDGSHRLVDVWLDTGLAWLLLAEGGILVWDDYDGKIAEAADLFVELVGASIVWRMGTRQLAVRKESQP